MRLFKNVLPDVSWEILHHFMHHIAKPFSFLLHKIVTFSKRETWFFTKLAWEESGERAWEQQRTSRLPISLFFVSCVQSCMACNHCHSYSEVLFQWAHLVVSLVWCQNSYNVVKNSVLGSSWSERTNLLFSFNRHKIIIGNSHIMWVSCKKHLSY